MSSSDPAPLPVGRQPTAVVVGGGIGGLAAGISLAVAGWRVTVLEQAPVFWEAGAGLLVTANGERALAALGVVESVRDAGQSLRLAGYRAEDGRWLARFGEGAAAITAVGIHRRSLQAALAGRADEVTELRLGARVVGVEPGRPSAGPAIVRWVEPTGQQELAVDLVVGADGVSSVIRPVVAPATEVRPSGFIAYRAVVADELLAADWTTWWGRGVEFSAQRISPDRVSWYCMFPSGPDAGRDPVAAATQRLSGLPAAATDVVGRTEPGTVIRHDISEVAGELGSLVAGRCVLVGDAGHAMLPTVSQGANLALEDGVTLGRLLSSHRDLDAGLRAFDRARLPRVQRIGSYARRLGALGAGCPKGLEQMARDALLNRVPASWVARYAARITAWTPPSGPSPLSPTKPADRA